MRTIRGLYSYPFMNHAAVVGLWVCAALLVSIIIGFSSAKMSHDISTEIAILSAILFPAFVMALLESRRIVPYILLVWAICPEIRRIEDWLEGSYHSVSMLSLAPLLTSAVLIIPVLANAHKIDSPIRKVLLFLSLALLYGSIIGLTKNGTGTFYDLVNYLIPMLLIPYFAVAPFERRDLDRLLIVFSNTAILVAVYGIVQYMTVPPWDAFWMNHVEMSSIGRPYPLEIRVFSTLNSPGPAGMFMGTALAPMILEKKWRGPLGWIGILLVAVGLLITLVRSAWLLLFIDIAVYTTISSGIHKWKLLTQIGVAATAMYWIIPKLPGAQILIARLETMTAIQDDHSYNERLDFFHTVFPMMLSQPQGLGLGSIGVGTKLNNGGALGEFGIFDNGFVAVFLTFGIIGGFLFFRGLGLLIKFLITRREGIAGLLSYRSMAVASIVGSVASLMFENGYTGLRGFLLWKMVGIGIVAHKAITQGRRRSPDAAANELEASRD
jgi:putative inorganic carbon (HCO3(-)) transporter